MNYKIFGGNENGRNQIDNKGHIYYNVRIDNELDGEDNGASKSCVYDKQVQDILMVQSDYEMCVESWNLRAKMPIFIATVKQGAEPDPPVADDLYRNQMPYSINFQYTTGGVTTNYPTELVWVPDFAFSSINPNRIEPLPVVSWKNNGIQDLTTNPDYYYCNSFAKMINIINTALKSSYDAFNLAHAGVHASAPFLQYDNKTGLMAVVGELSYANGTGVPTNKAYVGMDALLYKYFDSIPATFNGYNNVDFMDYIIAFEEFPGGSNAWALGNHYAGEVTNKQTTPPDYIIMEQESDCRYLWSNIKDILIVSNSINVRSEFMPSINFPQKLNQQNSIPNPNPSIEGTSQIADINTFNLDKKSIISYIDYNYASPNETTQTSIHRDIFYKPRYEKWIDLVSNAPLNNINIEVFFQTEDGFILPLIVPNKSSVNVKLQFRKKRY